MITVKSFSPPIWKKEEILRYSGIKETDDTLNALINECMTEAQDSLIYKVCFTGLDIVRNETLSFGNITTDSNTLQTALKDCNDLLLFSATVGIGIDRLIAKYGHISPAKALIFQAIGAERIESLCDTFCEQIIKEAPFCGKALKRRVSPGYGDIPLDMQRDIFTLLDCPRKIGLTLNHSLIMSPSKSVTAIAGITEFYSGHTPPNCNSCKKSNCEFRRKQ